MDIVVDTSALLAVIVAEPERDRIVELTSGHTLIGPGVNSPGDWECLLSHDRGSADSGLAEAQQGTEDLFIDS